METEEATTPDGVGSGGAGPEEVEEAVRLQAAESGGREGRRGSRERGGEDSFVSAKSAVDREISWDCRVA